MESVSGSSSSASSLSDCSYSSCGSESDDADEFAVTEICEELKLEMTEVGATVVNHVQDELCLGIDLDVEQLSPKVLLAWGLEPITPITITIRDLSARLFRCNSIPTVKVWQTTIDGFRSQAGVIPQLQAIILRFLREHWTEADSPINVLIGMGFKKSEASMVLRKVDNNLDKALESLMGEPVAFAEASKKSRKKNAPVIAAPIKKKHQRHRDDFEYDNNRGLFANLLEYCRFRLSWLHEVCPLCDEPHQFGTPMLKPAVCRNELCAFAFSKLGVMQDSVDAFANQSDVIDLLVGMFRYAAMSSRSEFVLNPFPQIYDPDTEQPLITEHAQHLTLARTALSGIRLTNMFETAHQVEGCHKLSYPLLNWVIASNRSHVVKLEEAQHIECMGTKHQFMLLSAPPEVEEAFSVKKERSGSVWAFHGSRAENWHCILRNGLKNMSGTKGQLNGAAYGPGVYVSPMASVSLGYSAMNPYSYANQHPSATLKSKEGDAGFLDENGFNCVAICEIIRGSEKRHNGQVWTILDDTNIVTRFLIVYPTGSVHTKNISMINTTSAEFIQQVENTKNSFF